MNSDQMIQEYMLCCMTEFSSEVTFTISFHFGTMGMNLKTVYNGSNAEAKRGSMRL